MRSSSFSVSNKLTVPEKRRTDNRSLQILQEVDIIGHIKLQMYNTPKKNVVLQNIT